MAPLSAPTATACIPNGNIIDVLKSAEYKDIIVSPWDPKVIREFRRRLAEAMNDSQLNPIEAFATHALDIAIDLCKKEHERIPAKERQWIASLGILHETCNTHKFVLK